MIGVPQYNPSRLIVRFMIDLENVIKLIDTERPELYMQMTVFVYGEHAFPGIVLAATEDCLNISTRSVRVYWASGSLQLDAFDVVEAIDPQSDQELATRMIQEHDNAYANSGVNDA